MFDIFDATKVENRQQCQKSRKNDVAKHTNWWRL